VAGQLAGHAKWQNICSGTYDVERGILTGEILERQRDRMTGESKYRIRGETIDGSAVEVLAKISPTGKLVILTVYAV
jgi:hypothetical protein